MDAKRLDRQKIMHWLTHVEAQLNAEPFDASKAIMAGSFEFMRTTLEQGQFDADDQQQAELKEWQDAALILCEVCDGSGFNKPGTGYDSTCDCSGGYTGRYTPQQIADKIFQQQAEIERLNRAYEVLYNGLIHFATQDIYNDYYVKRTISKAQRIKNGKDGEQG